MTTEQATTTVPDLRRDQMLRAAAELIAERGFSETRIADVARRSGASPALVIYYFGTKDQLLTEALRYSEDIFYQSVAGQLERLDTARERLELLVRLTCVPEGDGEIPGAWGLWFDLWAQALRHPEIAKDRIALDQRWRDTVDDVVRSGQAVGEIPKDADVETFTLTFAALLDGLSIQVALLDPDVDPERAFALAMGYVAAALGVDWALPVRRRRPSRTRR
ncbi:MAG TPA: TetR/AcrR family transcriptional regulator [Actinomycetes bacterium]|nr:TetR/AcrR family transcriptional regulator [Actinomycetes bacterium]